MQQRLRNKLFEQKRCPYYLTLFSRTVGFMPHALLALRVTKKNLDLSFTVQAFIKSFSEWEIKSETGTFKLYFQTRNIILKCGHCFEIKHYDKA